MYVLETIQLEESHGVVVKLEVLVEDSMVQGNVGPGECELEDKQLEADVLPSGMVTITAGAFST